MPTKFNQKGIIPLAILLIVVVVLAGGGIFIKSKLEGGSQSPEVSIPSPSVSSSPSASASATLKTVSKKPTVSPSVSPKAGSSASTTSSTGTSSGNNSGSSSSGSSSAPSSTTAPSATSTTTSTATPTPTPTPNTTISVSSNSVSVTLSKANAQYGLVYGSGFSITSNGATGFAIKYNEGTSGQGFYESSGGMSPGQTANIRSYINTNKGNGTFTGSAIVQYEKSGTWYDGPTVSYSITLTD